MVDPYSILTTWPFFPFTVQSSLLMLRLRVRVGQKSWGLIPSPKKDPEFIPTPQKKPWNVFKCRNQSGYVHWKILRIHENLAHVCNFSLIHFFKREYFLKIIFHLKKIIWKYIFECQVETHCCLLKVHFPLKKITPSRRNETSSRILSLIIVLV